MPLVAECGSIDFGNHTVKRWTNLKAQVEQLFMRFKPQLVIIEKNFIFKNVVTTAALNQLRGAVLLLAALHGVEVQYVDNNSAKKKVLGGTRYWDGTKYAGVTKEMMHAAVKAVLCGESAVPQDHDAADAVALGLTHYDVHLTPVPLARKPKGGK